MGKKEQHDGESSKTAIKRAKRSNLAALAAFRAADGRADGVRINEIQGDHLDVANSLRDLNCAVRRSPRKHTEHPIRPPRPPESNPGHTTNPIQSPPPPTSSPVHTTNPIQPPPPPTSSPVHTTNPIQPPSPPTSSPVHTRNSIQPPPPPASNPIHTSTPLDVTPSQLPSDCGEGYTLKKPRKKRGRTMLKSFAMLPSEKPEVEFNERGQAIGPNSKQLSSYIGVLAREMVPMTISEWKKVDDELRDDLWTCIQEHGGRVRGLGFGVVPSHLRIHRANLGEVHALRNQVSGMEAKLQELTAIILDMKEKRSVNEENPETPLANTPQSHRESNTLTGEERPKGDARHAGNVVGKCKILSWQKQVVAEGTVVSTDPDCLVHFKKLGPDGCKVWVDVAVDPEAFLWKASSEMCTIGEAVGSTVAWHKDFITFD